MTTWVKEVREADLERLDIDGLVGLSGDVTVLTGSYERHSLPVPEWLSELQACIVVAIKDRQRDDIKRKLMLAQARLETLKTPDEKRTETREQIAELQAQLEGLA